jgi:hypothetical protein
MQVPSSRWLGEAQRYEWPTADSSLSQAAGRLLETNPNSFASVKLRQAMLGGTPGDVVAIINRFDVPPWTGEITVGEDPTGEDFVFEDNSDEAMDDPTISTTGQIA